jgi:hypothetical protein
MNAMTINTTCRWVTAALLAMTSALSAGAATAAETDDRSESQQLAGELLSGMADFLAALPGFKVNLVCSYDVVQDSGQKIEFSELRKVSVARPDKLRIEQLSSDGAQDLVVFDGKDITIYNDQLDVFSQAPQPGSIDDSVVYFVRDLGIRLPLAAMLSSRLPEELEYRVKTVDYVEFTDILGPPAHHIAARTNTVDFQVWITDGERPLPLRVVLTYKTEPGQPQFRALFLNWDEQSPAVSEAFRFEPPADARKILFAVQGPAAATGSTAPATEPTGNKP